MALEHLTKDTFKEKVFNFEANKEWKYEGTKPAIIDFYADWCGPCKMVAPVLEELKAEYDDKLEIYKVNTEEERELVCHVWNTKYSQFIVYSSGRTTSDGDGSIT